ncbi:MULTISPECIES: hypothetical protein [unclassified Frankia]
MMSAGGPPTGSAAAAAALPTPSTRSKDFSSGAPRTLTPAGRNRILTTLATLGGEAAFEIDAAWRAKNLLLEYTEHTEHMASRFRTGSRA